MATLKILGERASKLEIQVGGYTTAAPQDPYDANWLQCSVDVDVGRFRGAVEASFMTQDFIRLADHLRDVLGGSSRKASFRTMEEALSFDIEVDRAGRAKVTGQLRDIETDGCTLDFAFENDLSFLEQTSEELRQIVAEFPERLVLEPK
jgi:hypothetical protein